jgi:hypothetical protein
MEWWIKISSSKFWLIGRKKKSILCFFKNEFENNNQSVKIQELVRHLKELTNVVHNSSDKVWSYFEEINQYIRYIFF